MARKYQDYVLQFKQLGYVFRFNELVDAVECNGSRITKPLEAKIKSQMSDRGFNNRLHVEEAWIRLAGENPFHPIKNYFEGLTWGGEDVFGQLCNAFDFQHRAFAKTVLWRFLVGAVSKVFLQTQNFCAVLNGKQGCGKSYWVAWACSPLEKYFVEGPLQPDSKDTQLRVISNFLWEIGEFQATTRKADQEALKNIISQKMMTVRRPYSKHDLEKPITASFIGTINENGSGFLTDTTGSRRFAIITVHSINWGYTKLDPNQLWAQVYHAFLNGETGFLEPSVIQQQQQINEGFQVQNMAVQLLHKYYEIDPLGLADEWIPIADIVTHLEALGLKTPQKLSQMDIAGELQKLGCEKSTSNVVTGNGRLTCYNGVREKQPKRVGIP